MTVVGLDVSECSFWLIGLACGALAYAAILLIRPILFPRVITYPWVDGVPQEKNMTVILAGSYNPPHYGHLAMLSYLSNRYVLYEDTHIAAAYRLCTL